MYDETNGGKNLRKYCSLNLAWWHNYKHGAFALWKVFAEELFAPMWHHLYPDTGFYKTYKNLRGVLAHYQLLQLAYPAIKDQLRLDCVNMQLAEPVRLQLIELQFVLDYAIPTVRRCVMTLSTFNN